MLSLAAFASAASLRATDPLLPQIAEHYGVTTGAASAAITAFALSYGLLQVVGGPLGDRFGRYRTIAAAALVSAFGSAACALAPTLWALVLGRIVQGAGGAAIPALASVSVARILPPGERGSALGLIVSSVGIGGAVGPLFGGVVGTLLRGDEIILPRGADVLHPGDDVIVFALPDAIPQVEALFD